MNVGIKVNSESKQKNINSEESKVQIHKRDRSHLYLPEYQNLYNPISKIPATEKKNEEIKSESIGIDSNFNEISKKVTQVMKFEIEAEEDN